MFSKRQFNKGYVIRLAYPLLLTKTANLSKSPTSMKRFIKISLTIIIVVLATLILAGNYLLDYALQPDPNRTDTDSAYAELYEQYPDMESWVNNLKAKNCLLDTFITVPTGLQQHAIYIKGSSKQNRTAIIVHGYKDCSIKFLYLAKMYNEHLGYNVLLPDLHAHGLSEGGEIQMGWKDADDLLTWCETAYNIFSKEDTPTSIIVHGISMGAATTMNLSSKKLPSYIKGFIEDCGYTSVWEQFKNELQAQFGLPSFPLLNIASELCNIRYGWRFQEASPLYSVRNSILPMLFIHGNADTFVQTEMVNKLYNAKDDYKQLWIVPEAKHAKSYKTHPQEYTEQVNIFCNKIFNK